MAMSVDTILNACTVLEARLRLFARANGHEAVPNRLSEEAMTLCSGSLETPLIADHLLYMLQQIRDFTHAAELTLDSVKRMSTREKLMRWLGWVQAAVWFADLMTLDDLKRLNMPPGETFKTEA